MRWRLECASRFVFSLFCFPSCYLFFFPICLNFHSFLCCSHTSPVLWFPLNSGGRMELDLCTKAKYYYIRFFLYSPEILKQAYITLYWKMENEEEKKEYIVLLVYFLFFFSLGNGYLPQTKTRGCWPNTFS